MSEQYEHLVYKPGMRVYVDPAIRQIHAEHRVAGKIVEVTRGPDYSQLLTPEELSIMNELEPESGVPVSYDGHIFYIEEQYVKEVSNG